MMCAKGSVVTGKQLIRLLLKDGWAIRRRARHGLAMTKSFNNRTRVTIIPDTRAPLDDGTLAAILGAKQSGIGKPGLQKLIDEHGL